METYTQNNRSSLNSGNSSAFLEISELFDSYIIISLLSSGNGTAVYKAWHIRLRRFVILKAATQNISDNQNTTRNEAEALKNMKNVHLPQVYDYIEVAPNNENSSSYTVIEYVDGESFDKLTTRRAGFSEADVIKWYEQLACALEALHENNISHRDIKPTNIILTSKGDVCLIDFNHAHIDGFPMKVINCSYGFASPEQLRFYEFHKSRIASRKQNIIVSPIPEQGCKLENHDNTGTDCTDISTPPIHNLKAYGIEYSCSINPPDWKLSDIYSLGATMFHILTGKRPPERALDIMAELRNGCRSRRLRDIIVKSMHENPAERYESASMLLTAIKNMKYAQSTTDAHRFTSNKLFIGTAAAVVSASVSIYAISLLKQSGFVKRGSSAFVNGK